MTHIGLPAKVKLYILGNPLIARTMLQHDLGVGLNVPVPAMIFEDPKTGKTHFGYDLPSSLMGRLGNQDVTTAAKRLDEKLTALAKSVTEPTREVVASLIAQFDNLEHPVRFELTMPVLQTDALSILATGA